MEFSDDSVEEILVADDVDELRGVGNRVALEGRICGDRGDNRRDVLVEDGRDVEPESAGESFVFSQLGSQCREPGPVVSSMTSSCHASLAS